MRGGSSETDENELAVMPTRSSPLAAVITVTPVPNWPRQRRNAAGSALGSPLSIATSDWECCMPSALRDDALAHAALEYIGRPATGIAADSTVPLFDSVMKSVRRSVPP